ncbi:MAG TPA: DEAD/DEAH box helicase [Terriglobia bacterium]|nr:DEAD/DEAH box helicase [Terriglobia bacterium]
MSEQGLIPSSDHTPLSIARIVEGLKRQSGVQDCITHIEHFPAREAQWASFPSGIAPLVRQIYASKGIDQLYSHQAEAVEKVLGGRNVVIVTPTASGKTLCYNVPVLNSILGNPDTRAMYLFPTKALAQDQMEELYQLIQLSGKDIRTFTYDGDTPQDARKAIRSQGHVVVTNPDMLHTGILPHHTKWVQLFENIKYVVIDELHSYRGVFGSHLTNVLRRLKRICLFYGSKPQFICCSATIANPRDLAVSLLEEDVDLVDNNGAPQAEKYFVFYNPPVVNKQLGIRRSYVNESRDVALSFLRRGFQTVVFANTRLVTEILLTYLKDALEKKVLSKDLIRGYRGGYLPLERREVEKGLREGKILGVVATNALELGVDIGSLEVCVMAGYSGSIASTWQRAGRAGRRTGTSAAVLVANSSPLDQFIVQHPEYFLGQSPEHGLVNPNNLEILLSHFKCAIFELPFSEGERFGAVESKDILNFLRDGGFVHAAKGKWHWTSESYPADAVSLRSVSSDNFIVVDTTKEPRIVSKVDFTSALTALHEKAIYLHEGQQYFVEKMDYKERRAYVKKTDSDYFTDAISYTKVKILETFEKQMLRNSLKNHGEIHLTTQIVGFKKIKFYTLENVGAGDLELPEQEMHTTAFWLTLPRATMDSLPYTQSARLGGIRGLAQALRQISALFLMCDPHDIQIAIEENLVDTTEVQPQETRFGRRNLVGGAIFEPNLFIYDNYPGGIGLSQPLFEMHERVLSETARLIRSCPCEDGCPSCVGPKGEIGDLGKKVALEILSMVL